MIWYIQETIKYRMRVIITRDLYILNTLFEGQYIYLREFFLRILALCTISIQKRFLKKSGL